MIHGICLHVVPLNYRHALSEDGDIVRNSGTDGLLQPTGKLEPARPPDMDILVINQKIEISIELKHPILKKDYFVAELSHEPTTRAYDSLELS